jgi:VWFA-related protein
MKGVAALAVGTMALVMPLGAQQQGVFRAGVEGVRIDVIVTDDDGPVQGLTSPHFEVYDAGVRQAIESIETPGTMALALVLDRSASVRFGTRVLRAFEPDTPSVPPGWPTLVDYAGRMLSLLGPDDEAGLLTFGGRIVLHARATRDHDGIRGQIEALANTVQGTEPFSPVAEAVMTGASLVANRPGRPVVALLSDGIDTASWLTTPKAARGLQRAGITVDMVSVPRTGGHSEGFAGGPYPPELIAEATGGRQFEASAPDLAEQLATRFAELRSSYVITYTPKGVEEVEGFHEVEIRLVGVDGRVQARPGYFTGPGR